MHLKTFLSHLYINHFNNICETFCAHLLISSPIWFHPANSFIHISYRGQSSGICGKYFLKLAICQWKFRERSCQMVCAVCCSALWLYSDKPLIWTRHSLCFLNFSIYFHISEIAPLRDEWLWFHDVTCQACARNSRKWRTQMQSVIFIKHKR